MMLFVRYLCSTIVTTKHRVVLFVEWENNGYNSFEYTQYCWRVCKAKEEKNQ